MINDFLDNLAAHQYQKMHKKKKKIEAKCGRHGINQTEKKIAWRLN